MNGGPALVAINGANGHDVVGFDSAPEHAGRDSEQAGTRTGEDRNAVIVPKIAPFGFNNIVAIPKRIFRETVTGEMAAVMPAKRYNRSLRLRVGRKIGKQW